MTSTTVVHRRARQGPRSLASLASLAVAIAVTTTGCTTVDAAHRAVTAPAPASGAATATPTATPTTTPSRWRLPAGAHLIAVARHAKVTVTSASQPSRTWRLANPNARGARLLFLVIGERPDAWLVRVPARPNGSTGWVRNAAVDIQVDAYALEISLGQRTGVLRRYGHVIRTFPVGVGRPDAPTPTGRFYLTELLQPSYSTGPYGAYAYGLSAFSDVYSEFEGGPGQIGLHGTNDPASVGTNVSHGCLRLAKKDITFLAHTVPAGTPITITR